MILDDETTPADLADNIDEATRRYRDFERYRDRTPHYWKDVPSAEEIRQRVYGVDKQK